VVEVVASSKLQDVSDARLHPCPSKPSKLDLSRASPRAGFMHIRHGEDAGTNLLGMAY
jgi:hypothetical protein